MYLSRYSKIFPSAEEKDSVILFSTKNLSAILAPSSLIKDIADNRLSSEEQEALSGLGLLVHDPAQERREMLDYIQELNAIDPSMHYVVVLNLDCNLDCTYCFEGARKGKQYLSDEIAGQFVEFVRSSDFTNKEEIRITFYGGEPLLSAERIIAISEQVRALAHQKRLKYVFSLVTNGTLLTPEVVRQLVPLGLAGAKITLDGPERIHNQYRPFTSGVGSFDVIVRNVKAVSSLIRIQIGGNYTREHYREFPRLLDHLARQGITPDTVPVVKFDPVINETSEFAPPDFHDGCESVNEPWISEATLFLREEILKRGYKTPKVMPSPCLVLLQDNLVMNVDGRLYKCPGMIGRDQCCVGDVRNGVKDYRGSHGLDVWKKNECLACEYLPLCFGGCKYMALIRDNTMNGTSCRKDYLDRTLGGLVAQDIRYNL